MKPMFHKVKEDKLDEKTVITLIKIADSQNDFDMAMKLIKIGSQHFKNSLSFHGFVGDFLGSKEQLRHANTSATYTDTKITSKL